MAAIRRGWAVLGIHWPVSDGCSCAQKDCKSVGKHPRTRHGLKDATLDSGVILEWWRHAPLLNFGIVVGPGWWVLDVDPRHGGDESLAALEQEHSPLPSTRTIRTGSNGRHLYFTGDVRQRAGFAKDHPGLDTRSLGRGYVVGPGSYHASGRRYAVEVDAPLAEPPAWLVELVNGPPKPPAPPPPVPSVYTGPEERRRYVAGAVRGAVSRIGAAAEGTRNVTVNEECFAIGRLLAWAELPATEVVGVLTEAALSADQHPEVVRRALADGFEAGHPGVVLTIQEHRPTERRIVDRHRLARLAGLEVVDGRARGVDCPRCGEPRVSFAINTRSSATCPCGWTGGLRALVGSRS